MDLRRQGWSLERIGAELKSERKPRGINKQRVHQIITWALDKSLRENTEQVRKIELDRLDELQAAWYKKAVEGDPVALDKVRALLADRARLLGLNAPLKIENTGKDGEPMAVRVIEDAAAMFDRRLRCGFRRAWSSELRSKRPRPKQRKSRPNRRKARQNDALS